MLATTGHRAADDVVATLAVLMSSHYLSTMVADTEERCRRGHVLGGEQVIAVVRAALEDIVRIAERAADEAIENWSAIA